jgi:hypothetical protein
MHQRCLLTAALPFDPAADRVNGCPFVSLMKQALCQLPENGVNQRQIGCISNLCMALQLPAMRCFDSEWRSQIGALHRLWANNVLHIVGCQSSIPVFTCRCIGRVKLIKQHLVTYVFRGLCQFSNLEFQFSRTDGFARALPAQ